MMEEEMTEGDLVVADAVPATASIGTRASRSAASPKLGEGRLNCLRMKASCRVDLV
jgi:hypothetical protein